MTYFEYVPGDGYLIFKSLEKELNCTMTRLFCPTGRKMGANFRQGSAVFCYQVATFYSNKTIVFDPKQSLNVVIVQYELIN